MEGNQHQVSSKSRRAAARYKSTSALHPASSSQHRRLTHLDEEGRPAMVDVSNKDITERTAVARGRIYIPQIAYDLVRESSEGVQTETTKQLDANTMRRRQKAQSKGNVLTVAQLAGIMASKKTSDLIPLCHPIPLSHISVKLNLEATDAGSDPARRSGDSLYSILCEATVTCDGKTGVEMEALTAVSTSLLTVWDMLKAVAGKEMVITDLCVVKKSGGKSGDFIR